jgi:hypothetical protein
MVRTQVAAKRGIATTERRVAEWNGDVVSNPDRNGDIALGGKALDAEKVEAQFTGGASVVGYVWDGRAKG